MKQTNTLRALAVSLTLVVAAWSPPARGGDGAELARKILKVRSAIADLKKYKRDWKINLIEHENRLWIDFYPALIKRGQR